MTSSSLYAGMTTMTSLNFSFVNGVGIPAGDSFEVSKVSAPDMVFNHYSKSEGKFLSRHNQMLVSCYLVVQI